MEQRMEQRMEQQLPAATQKSPTLATDHQND